LLTPGVIQRGTQGTAILNLPSCATKATDERVPRRVEAHQRDSFETHLSQYHPVQG